jgi:hypothetical protein
MNAMRRVSGPAALAAALWLGSGFVMAQEQALRQILPEGIRNGSEFVPDAGVEFRS